MSCSFSISDMEEFISSNNKASDHNINFPDNMGFINTQKEYINEDISLFKTSIKTYKDISFETQAKVDRLLMNIVLEGDFFYEDIITNKSKHIYKNNILTKYANEYFANTFLKKNKSSKSIGMSISESFLDKYLFNECENKDKLKEKLVFGDFYKVQNKNTRVNNLKLAYELYTSPFEGNLNKIYLQSKIFEIVYNEFRTILNEEKINSENKIKFSQEDIEALIKAKTFIMELNEDLTITYLSKKVALNEFKLKYGFKKYFNTSPGNMILEQRMIKAKTLIESSEYNLNEISQIVGYKYQQSFTKAFTKYFRVRPMDIMKNRKYYY